MFTEIRKLIEERKFDEAISALLPLYQDKNTQTAAYAGYLLGYINTRYDYKQGSPKTAIRYLRENINGNYPHPYAFVLYSRIEDDNNIAVNYLEIGQKLFPKDTRILGELLTKSPDKNAIVNTIKDIGVDDPWLLGGVISYLISEHQWGKIGRFILRMENFGEIDEDDRLYLNLLKAFAYIFRGKPNYEKAQDMLEQLVSEDPGNNLAYSHYLGLIFVLVKRGRALEATRYFDRLLVNNSIMDFDERPFPFGLCVDFIEEYKIIFATLLDEFDKDMPRKQKARALFALYLYHPSETFDVYRYQKSDATALMRYLKAEFNPKVAAALFNMRCHFKQYQEAYDVVWCFLKENKRLSDYWVFISEMLEDADETQLHMLAEQTIIHLENDDYDSTNFAEEVFAELVEKLHKHQMHACVQKIAEYLSDNDIISCGRTFECAYAFSQVGNGRATVLYEKLVKNEPNNSAALNNLGVRYREHGELYRALLCYERASDIDPQKELYRNNLKMVKASIREQVKEELKTAAKQISMDTLQGIGYTVDLCKKVYLIQDEVLRKIIERDLRECAIAVVAGQDKLATIMCGSIAEALLFYRVSEKGITKYDVRSDSRRHDASSCPVSEMVLNELLYVALKEGILDRSEHNLGHYLKDYRNMIHPSREVRSTENIDHENVTTMWSVLVRMISTLFPN